MHESEPRYSPLVSPNLMLPSALCCMSAALTLVDLHVPAVALAAAGLLSVAAGRRGARPHRGEGAPAQTCDSALHGVGDRPDTGLERTVQATAHRRFHDAERLSFEGFWDLDMQSGVARYCPRWSSAMGMGERAVESALSTWLDRVHDADRVALREKLDAARAGESDGFVVEYRVSDHGERARWMRARGAVRRSSDGHVRGLAGTQLDITESRIVEEALRRRAFFDPLTGLPNRARFLELLERAMASARTLGRPHYAVLFLDLDRFKFINDSLGHLAGDQLLVQLAERVRACLRLSDTVGRLGGDEFVVLLEDIDEITEAEQVADRILGSLREAFVLEGQEVFCSVSIGIASGAQRFDGAQAVLRDADTAMYHAKALGKDRFAVFDDDMRAQSRELLQLQTELRGALTREEFELRFQPVVDLRSTSLAGFEALLRWRHPTRGVMSPAEFMPAAGELGLLPELDAWVLSRACRQLAEWQRELPEARELTLAVNVSAQSASSPALAALVRRVLAQTGVRAQSLILDVVETAVTSRERAAADTFARLKRLGVTIHIDDFGTGLSSLATLHCAEVDALKLDRSFVSKMKADEGPSDMLVAMASLARGLGVRTVAEGIQTGAQLATLRALGCDFGQGYFFSRPLEPEQARALMIDEPVEMAAPSLQ